MEEEVQSNTEFNTDEFVKKLSQGIGPLVRASLKLPKEGDEYEFYSTFPDFKSFVAHNKSTVLPIIGKILKNQGIQETFTKAGASQYVDIDDLTDHLVSCNDKIMERVSIILEHVDNGGKIDDDEIQPATVEKSSLKKTASRDVIISSWNKKDKNNINRNIKLYSQQAIPRPQAYFKYKVDNSAVPFIPKICEKPNQLRPLPQSLVDLNTRKANKDLINDEYNGDPSMLAVTNFLFNVRHFNADDKSVYEHPYKHELEMFTPNPWQLERREPIPHKELVAIDPSDVVDTVEKMKEMLSELRLVNEIAIDLEHHSYRSYLGITCLMQISTREKDWIVDTIALREDLQPLNQVFTDPKIVKVLHGANSDVIWLQRCLGLYIVNMFDTGLAARQMEYGASLKFLLMKYLNKEMSKEYQMADWRFRPLDTTLINYAQGDTHYLLHLYDLMRNELIEKSPELHMIKNVYQRSTELCMKKFEKPIIEEFTHLDLLIKFNNRRRSSSNANVRSPQQKMALKTLFAWRDAVARQEDESTGYVLPNHMLIQLANRLPREPEGIIALCNPVPPMVRQHQMEIYQIVQDAINFKDEDCDVTTAEKDKDDVTATETLVNTIVSQTPHENTGNRDEAKLGELRKTAVKLANESSMFSEARSKSFKRSRSDDPEHQKKKRLRLVSDLQWNPLQLFMPGVKRNGKLKLTDDGEAPSLKLLLSGKYMWKVVKPKKEVKEEVKPQKKEKKREQGEIIEIDESCYVSTEEQVRRMQQKKKERKRETQGRQQQEGNGGGQKRNAFVRWDKRKGGRR